MSDIIKRLDNLGRWDPRSPKSALSYFRHTSGRVQLSSVRRFFKEAVALAEEASRTIHELRNEIEEMRDDARDAALERDLADG